MGSFAGTGREGSDLALRRLLSEVMGACGKDRETIAAELSRKTGRPITASILNDYTATTKTAARFPAAYVRGLCEVTGNDSLQRFVLEPRLLALIEIGERELAAQRNRSAKDSIVRQLLTDEDQKRS